MTFGLLYCLILTQWSIIVSGGYCVYVCVFMCVFVCVQLIVVESRVVPILSSWFTFCLTIMSFYPDSIVTCSWEVTQCTLIVFIMWRFRTSCVNLWMLLSKLKQARRNLWVGTFATVNDDNDSFQPLINPKCVLEDGFYYG